MAAVLTLPVRESPPRRRVSVVVVSYDSGASLLRCLATIDHDDEGIDEIVVVENGAGGEELEIAARSPRVRVIRSPRNVGFGAGCNLGAAGATGDALVFLNPDTVPAPGAVRRLVGTLDDPSVAIAMARLRLLWDPDLLNSHGTVVHVSGLGWCGGHGLPAAEVTDVVDVASPSGAAMAMNAEEFARIGGFREELFLYQEDIELGWRAQMQGRRVVLNPRADVYHDYDFDRNASKRYFMERNRLVFVLLDLSWRTLLVLAPLLAATELAMLVLAARQGWLRQKVGGWVWLARNLPALLRRRAETQRARTVPDRDLATRLTATIHPGVVGVPVVVRALNPLLAAYWWAALKLIR